MEKVDPFKGLDYLWLDAFDHESMLVEIELDGKFVATLSQEEGVSRLLMGLPGEVEFESLVQRVINLKLISDALTELTTDFERDFPQNRSAGGASPPADGVDDMSPDALSYAWEDGSTDQGRALVIGWNGLLVAHVRREGERDDLVVEFPGPDAPEDRIVRKIRVKVFQHALKTAAAMFRDK